MDSVSPTGLSLRSINWNGLGERSFHNRFSIGLSFGQPTPSVSVVIPTLNEAKNLPYVLPLIPKWVHEVVLVDGRSTDDTVQVARELMPDIVIVNQTGRGKGDALRAGFAAATGDIIVMMDADGSTDPSEIPAFVGALVAGADFAKGSRFVQGGGTDDMGLLRKLGNWGFVTLVRLLSGGRYTDLCYGYNAFWKRVFPQLELDADGFEIETLMNLRALRSELKVVEVSSFEASRRFGTSNLNTFRDGWRVLKTILRESFRRRRVQDVTVVRPEPEHDETFGLAMQTILNESLHFVLFGGENISPEASQRALDAARASFSILARANVTGQDPLSSSQPGYSNPQFILTLSPEALGVKPADKIRVAS